MIDLQEIRQIKIYSSNEVRDTILLEKKEEMKIVVDQINTSINEPIKFYPETSILVLYRDQTELLILSSGTAIKANGKTYRMQKPIRKIVQALKNSS
jgi:hypothetical protein